MSEKGSKINLVENDELEKFHELKEKDTPKETDGLINNIKQRFNIEFNGLFYIILSIIVFAIAVTIAMILSIFFGPPQIRPHAGVSSQVTECTEIGLNICNKGGSGVDSAIGTFLCLTIVRPDITSLGGCGSMIIHNHTSMTSNTIDFSCVAPPNSNPAPIKEGYGIKESVAIPGVFSGLQLAHKLHGKMNWTKIIELVTETLVKGVKVTSEMKTAFTSSTFKNLPENFKTLYQNWASGPKFVPSKDLLKILSTISNETISSGVNGSLANEIIDLGFSWMGNFNTARQQKPLMAIFGDYSLYTSPLPSQGGLILAMSYQMLNKVLPHQVLEKENSLFYHKLIEALKVSQSTTSFLGDSDNGKEPELLSPSSIQKLIQFMANGSTYSNLNYGPYYRQADIESGSGTHISVLDPFSMYVSMTVNLGSKFGSGITTKSGIILNDAMRLFTPSDDSTLVKGTQIRNTTTSNNKVGPGKRPINQLVPLIVYNFKRKCGVRFAVGGDHGSRSSTGNLQMIMAAIYLDQKFCPSKDCMELSKAGSRPRLHVNILEETNPEAMATIYYDESFPLNIRNDLSSVFKDVNNNVSKVAHSLNSIGKVQYEFQGFSNSLGGGFSYF